MSLILNGTTGITSPGGDTSTADDVINGLTVGLGAGSTSASTVLGVGALSGSNTGNYNTAIGKSSLLVNTSGSENVSIGFESLKANTTGAKNVSVGTDTMASNTTGGSNTALGWQALVLNTTASNNTAVGYQAGYTNSLSSGNTFFGYQAGYSHNVASLSSSYNTFIGNSAGYTTSTGVRNTFVGINTGYYNTTGSYNTFIGSLDSTGNYSAGNAITTGSKNTIIGNYSGNNGGLDIRTASNYIVLSDGDGNPRGYFDNSGTFITGQVGAINGGITLTSVYGTSTYRTSNNANYGIHSFYSDYGSTQSQRAYFSGNGGLANYSANNANLSDERMKKDISLAGNYLDKICSIPVKTFLYTDQEDEALNLGVIAQDVQAVAPELICTDGFGEVKAPDGSELLTVYETDLMYALMKSIQELKAEVDSLKAQLGK